jgi:hypothetical protein
MAPRTKPKASKKPTYNKAKTARRAFKPKTAKYKSDHQEAVCCAFVDTVASIDDTSGAGGVKISEGSLTTGGLADNGAIQIAASICLDADAALLSSHRHTSLKNMFNEWNTSAIYLDLLFSPALRAHCDQVFILVERGVRGLITDESQMVSDVNCRMYQLGNNTQKLTFKHVFTTVQDKINKASTARTIDPGQATYLKILCKGKATSAIEAGDLQIKLRAKCYNKYRDMKALSAALN